MKFICKTSDQQKYVKLIIKIITFFQKLLKFEEILLFFQKLLKFEEICGLVVATCQRCRDLVMKIEADEFKLKITTTIL